MAQIWMTLHRPGGSRETKRMGKIIRREYLGSHYWFWIECISVILLPLAILRLLDGLVRVEEDVTDPTAVLEAYRAGRGRRG